MAINDIMQARFVSTLHGQTLMNVLHYKTTDAGVSFGDFAAMCDSVLAPAILSVQADEVLMVRVDVNKINPLPVSFTISQAVGDMGSLAGGSEASAVAMTITKQTAFAGRSFRGRVFLGGVPIVSTGASVLNAGALAGLQGLADILAANQSAGAGTAWIPMLQRLRDPVSGIHQYEPIVACRANAVLRSQRRRQVGVGI